VNNITSPHILSYLLGVSVYRLSKLLEMDYKGEKGKL